MNKKKNILAIIGSASLNSSNLKLIEKLAAINENEFKWTILNNLKSLPHFDPELSINNPPKKIIKFREAIERADGLLICTPEYIFSIPSGLKNAIEWCISSIIFTDKPTGLITASANGIRGHEELQLIMKTAMAKFNPKTTLLIQGVKGKFDDLGNLIDTATNTHLEDLMHNFSKLVNEK